MSSMQVEESKNQVLIPVSSKIYPLEAIYAATYVFLDHYYVFLDEDKNGKIVITLKGKEKMNKKQLADIGGELYNELLSDSLRYQISKNNQKIRESIVGRAIIGAIGDREVEKELEAKKSHRKIKEESEEEIEEWKGDTAGIAIPWEKKVKKTK